MIKYYNISISKNKPFSPFDAPQKLECMTIRKIPSLFVDPKKTTT